VSVAVGADGLNVSVAVGADGLNMSVAVGADGLNLLPNFIFIYLFIYCLFSDFISNSDCIAGDNVTAK